VGGSGVVVAVADGTIAVSLPVTLAVGGTAVLEGDPVGGVGVLVNVAVGTTGV
jgi:hypothetical protein